MSSIEHRVKMLEQFCANQVRLRVEAERRISNMLRQGRVTEVDPAKGLVKVAYNLDENGQDVVSPWIPWTERAGSIKTWSPPSEGEQVQMFSPSGEVSGASWVLPGGYSNANKQPHDKNAEHKLEIGGASILVTGDKITITCGEIVLAGNTHLGGEGGKLVHRKDDVDSGGDLAVGSATKVFAV